MLVMYTNFCTAVSFCRWFTVNSCWHLSDIKVVVIGNILSQAHFTGEVLIKCPRFFAVWDQSRVGPLLPFPRWDGRRFGKLEVLEHVLSSLLLSISKGVQSCEGTVLYLWRGLLRRWPGRGAWRTLLVAHCREWARLERIGCGGLTPTWSTKWPGWWRLAPGEVGWGKRRGTKLRWHLLAPGCGWYG